MIISVINCTNGQLRDEDVQSALRAVNRQIAEDFQPYWNMGGTLRLEGKGDVRRDPDEPADMRGDAVLYLWDKVDVDDALGYHDRNHRGVPFGVIFLEIIEQVGEPWSVTLSHEALELIADPEVNLLVKGPHPADSTREVFHWFEMCDAVQDERYEIDGLGVSNFVLPMYFSSDEEQRGRNDFLGRSHSGATLRSFGVAQGGYIGFYDPATRSSDTYSGDARGEARRRIKLAAGAARRAVRYQLPPAAVARAAGNVPAARPVFEAFAIQPGADRSSQASTEAIVARVLGPRWRVERFGATARHFSVSRPGAPLSVREAWELTYRLRADRDVLSAEPLFMLPSERGEARAHARGETLFGGGDLPGARDDYQWSLKQVHAMAAWALPPDPGGATRGAGVKVGHPDTGYTHHPDIWPAAPTPQPILVAECHNFIDGEDANDPTDALVDGFLKNPGHGTGTSSVIVGVPGAGLPPAPPWATGVAPDARIVPLRTSTSVVLWSMENLIKAIHYAVDHGCHLVSISMGGLGGDALHESVRYAVGQDVIVLAAAGNDVGFVVWPAAYDEVLAVAATNILRQPWIGSSKGPAVDFSAPGESVWRATAKKNNGGPAYEVSMGDGTSFAVATAAGICALWLANHGGRDALREKYGQGNVTAVFKELVLQHGCETDGGWDSDNYGVGIIGAVKVLQAAMPLSAPARGMRAARSTLISDDVGGVETFVHLFPELSRGEVRAALARTLRVTDNQLAGALRTTGHELAFHLAAHDGLRAAFTTAARPSNGDHARAFAAGAPLDPYESIRQRLSNHGASRRLLGGGLP